MTDAVYSGMAGDDTGRRSKVERVRRAYGLDGKGEESVIVGHGLRDDLSSPAGCSRRGLWRRSTPP